MLIMKSADWLRVARPILLLMEYSLSLLIFLKGNRKQPNIPYS